MFAEVMLWAASVQTLDFQTPSQLAGLLDFAELRLDVLNTLGVVVSNIVQSTAHFPLHQSLICLV
jgi:hypothetical protein